MSYKQTITILEYDDTFFSVENSIASVGARNGWLCIPLIMTTIRHFGLAHNWIPIVAEKYEKMVEKAAN